MRTLDGVEPRIAIDELPFSINAPGSFYLVGDLTSTTNGILVLSDDVTIDLMGYNLYGPGAEGTHGIYLNDRKNVVVRNGTVHGFDYGLFASTSAGCQMLNLRVVHNAKDGISVSGSGHHVEGCLAAANGYRGIYLGEKSILKDNRAHHNGQDGILAQGSGSTVVGNVSYSNGLDGISVGTASTVIGNTAYDNGETGLSVWRACTVLDNAVYANNTANQMGDGGIYLWEDNLVKGNTVSDNRQANIYVAAEGNALEENLVSRSATGIYFAGSGNFYANTRSHGNTTAFDGLLGSQTDGGGNVDF
jgi:parallel beta-helix repeat protein